MLKSRKKFILIDWSCMVRNGGNSLELIRKLYVSTLICNGRKLLAEKFFFKTLVFLKKNYPNNRNFDVFYLSILNLRPLLGLKVIKIGHMKYRIPSPMTERKRVLYAIKLFIGLVKNKNKIDFDKLSEIMFLTFVGIKNVALEKKLELYREISNNKVFLKFIK